MFTKLEAISSKPHWKATSANSMILSDECLFKVWTKLEEKGS